MHRDFGGRRALDLLQQRRNGGNQHHAGEPVRRWTAIVLALCVIGAAAFVHAQNRIASGSTYHTIEPQNVMPYSIWTNCVLWLTCDQNPSNNATWTVQSFGSEATKSDFGQTTASKRPAYSPTSGLVFDGIDDVCSRASLSLNGLAGATFMAWFYFQNGASDINGRIFDNRAVNGYIFGLNNTNTSPAQCYNFFVDTATGDFRQITLSANSVLTNVWTHVAAVYGANVATIYTNGAAYVGAVTTNSSGTGNIVDDGAACYFGDRSAGDRSLQGKLDDAFIFNRALTAAEIALCYTNTLRSNR
jgi:hypothetical protein